MDDTPVALPLPLPFDDELDAPVRFSLTPRARREVAPEQVPALRLVPPDGERGRAEVSAPQDPTDVRPAQARALRRSGMPVPTIAAAIGADLRLVVGWTKDTEPVRRTARRVPRGHQAAAPAKAPARAREVPTRPLGAREARGMAVALAEFDTDLAGVGFTHARPEVLGAVLEEIRRQVPVADWRVRVAIRVAAELGVDRCRGAVAAALGVDAGRIVAGRWSDAPTRDALEVSLHIADEDAARSVRVWMDGLAASADADRAAG
jgi:hypothetical protein